MFIKDTSQCPIELRQGKHSAARCGADLLVSANTTPLMPLLCNSSLLFKPHLCNVERFMQELEACMGQRLHGMPGHLLADVLGRVGKSVDDPHSVVLQAKVVANTHNEPLLCCSSLGAGGGCKTLMVDGYADKLTIGA